jgi:selenide, water dikinase
VATVELLLVGCGHAHLFVLEALAAGRLRGYRATLVSPDEEYFYSGMVPGVLAGCYHPADARFLPPRLAAAAGARWLQGRAVRIDAARRAVALADGSELSYDVLSVDIGARLVGHDTPGVAGHAVPVRPMRRALEALGRAEAAVRDGTGRRAELVVVGGGAAGVEVGFCLAARFGRSGARVTVLEGGQHLLGEHGAAFRRRAGRLLVERGVAARTDARVREVERGEVGLRDGGTMRADLVVWATGPRAPRIFRRSELDTDDAGYLRVGPGLRSAAHPAIFGAGDCVSLRDHPDLPRAGVFAVRQGPVLVDNLEHHLADRPLDSYEPQRHWLSLLNTGDGRALLSYRGVATGGRWAWWLKDRIDRAFIGRFRRLERQG